MPLLPPSFRPFWMDGEDEPPAPPRGAFVALVFFFILCGGAAAYASLYNPSEAGAWGWYSRLQKPAWILDTGDAAQISTLFYAVLAVAIWRIWRKGALRSVPFTFAGFAALLILQAAWTTLFFGMQSPLLGLAALVLLLALGAILWLVYAPIDAVAGWLWLAYLGWILFQIPGQAAIWRLNG